MTYRVSITPAASKTIARLPLDVRERITERLSELSKNPRPVGSIKLHGDPAYRTRIGDYRLIYEIHDKVLWVLVVDVGHRRDIYRQR